MDLTDRLSLSYVAAAQAQKHVTVNETTRALDALVQMSALSMATTAQPGAPNLGAGYILPPGKTGADWSGMADHSVAVYQDNAWAEYPPVVGMTVYIEDEAAHRVWDGTAWQGTGGITNSAPLFGVNAAADPTNRLAVKSDALLFSHDDVTPGTGDVRQLLNKASAGNTASVLFQSGFSGRAEFGLTGTDDFTMKVSPDGASFFDGIVIDRTTGAVSFPNTPNNGGVSLAQAQALIDGLEARLVASGGVDGGNPAKTVQVVMGTNTGILQIGSAADGNLVEVFADGAARLAGNVSTQLTMAKGEVQVLTGVSAGAVVQSSHGVNGASGFLNGADKSPMPLGVEAFAGRKFYLYAFRNSAGGAGRVYVAAGAVPAEVQLLNGAGTVVVDQASLGAFGLAALVTDADAEFQVVADQPVFCAVAGDMLAGSEGFSDLRLVPPLSTEIIGYGSGGWVSALYANTQVNWYRRDGTSGSFTVSPGAPFELNGPGGTGAGNLDYEPDGCLILRASGPISAFSGADSQGYEATPFYPLSTLSQRIPLPLASAATGDGGDNGIAIASPHSGTAHIYRQDGTLYATVPITRSSGVTVPDDQLIPCAALLSADAGEATVTMTTNFTGGYVEADVPIYVVQNSSDNLTLLSGIDTFGDEVAWPGITPEELRAELRRDAVGMLRRRTIDAAGVVSWTLT